MKKRVLLSLIFISGFLFTLLFSSCKRRDVAQDKLSKEDKELIVKAISQSQESFILDQPVYLSGKGFYSDISGNKVMVDENVNLERGIAEKSTCPELGDAEFSQEFVSIKREFTCSQGYRFEIKYKVRTEFYPLESIHSAQFSFGRIRLKNSSGTVTYITPNDKRNKVMSIKNNGVVAINSLGEDLNEFEIIYRTEYISQAVFSAAAAIEPMLFLYTDCLNYPTMTIAFSPQQSSVGVGHNALPCLRVDKINFVGGGGYDGLIWGANGGSSLILLCGCGNSGSTACYPDGYVFPSQQEIWFKNKDGVWTEFRFMRFSDFSIVKSKYILPADVLKIPIALYQSQGGLPANGIVEVKYRNIGLSAGGQPCETEPADTWIYEVWYF